MIPDCTIIERTEYGNRILSFTGVTKIVMRHCLLSLLITGLCLLRPLPSWVADQPQPNIIFIMVDDLGYGDLGWYGQNLIETPNIDLLSAQGMRFTQSYAGSTVCAASRAVLMPRLHNGHAPARDNVPHYPNYLQESDVTIAEVLQTVGYRCGGAGKWSLGDAGTVGWATNRGFDMWFGYQLSGHASEQRGEHRFLCATMSHYLTEWSIPPSSTVST